MTPYSLILSKAAVQSIPDTTFTAMSFDTIGEGSINAGTLASPTNLLIAIPGLYLVTANAAFAGADSGTFVMQLQKEGSPAIYAMNAQAFTSNPLPLSVSAAIFFNAGDALNVMVQQTSGDPLDLGVTNFLNRVSIVQLG